MRTVRVLVLCGMLSATLLFFSSPAHAENSGCGAGFFKDTDEHLATMISTDYGVPYDQALAHVQSIDKNGDDYVCWKYTGYTYPSGAQARNAIDNKSNATQTS